MRAVRLDVLQGECWNTPRLGCGGIGLRQRVDYICRRAGESQHVKVP